MSSCAPLDKFKHNPYIAPSVAGLRRFLLHCDGEKIPHVVFACGTVVRYDLASRLPSVLASPEDAAEARLWSMSRATELCPADGAALVDKAYAALIASPPPPPGEGRTNTVVCDVSPDGGMPTWLSGLTDAPHPGVVSVLSPGQDELAAVEYALAAYRNDHAHPCVYCIVDPTEEGYALRWLGETPRTMHMPLKLE